MIVRAFTLAALVLCAADLLAAEIQERLSRAQTLAWSKQFDEAAAAYLDILHDSPSSRDALLGLARVRLWQGRYAEARADFRQLLARNSRDADAAEGAATAAYWSGDYRAAEREFEALDAVQPGRETVVRSLNELRSAAATTETIETDVIEDDQPFRAARSNGRVSIFTDPLTRWDAVVGGYALNSDIGGRHGVPFVVLQNETVLPSLRLTLTPSLGAIRTPDSKTHAIGGLIGRIRLASNDSLAVSFARREILSNATPLYPFVDVASIRWQHSQPWLASIGVEHDRFSDRNSAHAADAYALYPIVKRNSWTFWGGASTLARDSRESRFYVTTITAVLDPSGSFFHYSYRGAYEPYWTPQNLVEGRLIGAVERRFANANVRLQADGGKAHDDAVAFWPSAGPGSFPSEVGQSFFKRTYSPWRVRLTSSMPVARGMTLDISLEHSVTVFYRANSVHAALARRR